MRDQSLCELRGKHTINRAKLAIRDTHIDLTRKGAVCIICHKTAHYLLLVNESYYVEYFPDAFKVNSIRWAISEDKWEE